MTHPLNPAFALTDPPPVMEARRWLTGVTHPANRPLINVSQAAPVDSPPLGLRQALADAGEGARMLPYLSMAEYTVDPGAASSP